MTELVTEPAFASVTAFLITLILLTDLKSLNEISKVVAIALRPVILVIAPLPRLSQPRPTRSRLVCS